MQNVYHGLSLVSNFLSCDSQSIYFQISSIDIGGSHFHVIAFFEDQWQVTTRLQYVTIMGTSFDPFNR